MVIEKQRMQQKFSGTRNYGLIPYRIMVHPKSGRAPYFSTRWHKASAVGMPGRFVNIIPIDNYQGDLSIVYDAWSKYISSLEHNDHSLLLPIIALQEILFKDFKGILAVRENRIVGLVSIELNENNEASISILSASPYDIEHGNEDKIEDAMRAGVQQYTDARHYTLKIAEHEVAKSWDIDKYMHIVKDEMLVKQGPPGPPPRRGLQWKPSTHRWIRPDTAEEWSPKTAGQVWTPGKGRIPPGLTNVWITNDKKADLQATGMDSKGRKQYVYTAKHTDKAKAQKFKRLKALNDALPQLMGRIERDFAKHEEAQVLYFISQTGLRIGSERDTMAEQQAYGASTLLGKHIKVSKGRVKLDFIGKKGHHIQLDLKNDNLATFLASKIKGPNDQIFSVSDGEVRKYFTNISKGKFSPHNLRTWLGTSMAIAQIEKMQVPVNKKTFREARNAIGEFVSKQLGNTPGMALASYIDPMAFQSWRASLAEKGLSV